MKKYFVGLMVLAVAVFAAAFSAPKQESKKLFNNWFEYRGPLPGTDADLKEESNYFQVSAPSGCNSDVNLCAINVAGTGQHPDPFSQALESDIVTARSTQTPVSGYILLKQ